MWKFLLNYHTTNEPTIPQYDIAFVYFSSLCIRQKAFVAVITAYITVNTLTTGNGKYFMELSIFNPEE